MNDRFLRIQISVNYSFEFCVPHLFVCIETLSADLLDAYDAEYERIAQLYEKRRPVIEAYEKWLAFWNDFVAFTVSDLSIV